MKVLHVINRRDPDRPGLKNLNLDASSPEKNVYLSGDWDIPLEEAETLVGGMLFLHETKAKPSSFGGHVLSVEGGACRPARIRTQPSGRPQGSLSC